MQIRIGILDLHWKKGIWIQVMIFSLRFTDLFRVTNYFSSYFAYFYAKTWWTIQRSGNFYLSFRKVNILVLRVIFLQFLVDIFPMDPDPWIRIFLRIRIQEAKIFRIRILSTGLNRISKTETLFDIYVKFQIQQAQF